MPIRTPLALAAALASVVGLSACSSMGSSNMSSTMAPFSQASLPAAVQVPAGHKVAMETVGTGDITYECRAKKAMASEFE